MKTNVIQEKKKDAEIKVEVIRVKKGIPTIIEYNGHRYILQHPDQYRTK